MTKSRKSRRKTQPDNQIRADTLKAEEERHINRCSTLCGEGLRLVGVGGFIAGVFDNTLHLDFILLAFFAFAWGIFLDYLGGLK